MRGAGPVSQQLALDSAYRGGQRLPHAVYFGVVSDKRDSNFNMIKIGSTKNIVKRQREHANAFGQAGRIYKLVAAVNGDSSAETMVHNYFLQCRVDGGRELFYPKQNLCDYIRWLRSNFYVETEATPDVQAVSVEGWRPPRKSNH
jgi:hypothetical protein